jgi:hypothetical protein
MIINGNFDIWQRGTSFSANGFTADRWYLDMYGTGATCTLARGTKTVGQELPPTKSAYVTRATFDDTSSDGYITLQYRGPDLWTINNKTVTVSFWAYADVALELGIELLHHDGTAQHHDVITPVKLAITAGEYKFYTATFVCPSISGYTLTPGHHWRMNLWLSSDSTPWSGGVPHQSGLFYFSGFGMNYGDSYVPVRERTVEEERLLCSQFYQIISAVGLVGAYNESYVQLNQYSFPVLMRNTPQVIDDGVTFFRYSGTPGSLYTPYATIGSIAPVYNWTDAVIGEMFRCSGGNFLLDAELP